MSTDSEPQIVAWLASQQEAMVALLREIVDIDSGSYNKPGIDAVGDGVSGASWPARAWRSERLPQPNARRLPARDHAGVRPATRAATSC